MFRRLSEEEINRLDSEYSHKYVLYNSISSAVEDIESSKGGLRAVEVWQEVLGLEERLPQHFRMDRHIATERTNLMNKYDRFIFMQGDKWCYETPEKRKAEEIERSVMCVLLAFGMRLAQYWDNMVNPYEPIMERIRKMALQCQDKEMVYRLTCAYYDEEEIEEGYGNVAPEEDVLQPHKKQILPIELQPVHKKMSVVFNYFSCALATETKISSEYTPESFANIWNDLLLNENILRELQRTSRIENTLGKRDPEAEDEVKANDYNLKMVLNIIGILISKNVVLTTATNASKMFFDDTKDKYFKEREFMKFGTGDSGIPDEKMYDYICKVIEQHRNNS